LSYWPAQTERLIRQAA